MLQNQDKYKIEQYIDSVNCELRNIIQSFYEMKFPKKIVLQKTVECTVNRFTTESKMILSNVYNMLQTQTMADMYFQNIEKKDAFYKLNLLEKLKAKFNFVVPENIDYATDYQTVKKGLVLGAISVEVGSIIVSIAMHNPVPVIIGSIIAGIMVLILLKIPASTSSLTTIIETYLSAVKDSLMRWISDIERFYEEQVATIQ